MFHTPSNPTTSLGSYRINWVCTMLNDWNYTRAPIMCVKLYDFQRLNECRYSRYLSLIYYYV